MKTVKQRLKSIIPFSVWEFARTRKAVFFDIILNFGAYTCSTKYCGFTVYYNRGNSLINRLRKEKYFEKALCEHIIDDLNESKNKAFLDIGANIGLITLSVLSSVPKVRVYAFEPGPLQAGFFEKTIVENELSDRVTFYRNALGESVGIAKFFVHDGADIAKDGFKNTGRGEGGREISVSVETLDHWWRVAGEPSIAVVKIDTEGAELFVLQGGKEFLSTVKPILYLEIEQTNLSVYPYTAADTIRFLNSVGYDVMTLDSIAASAENINELTKKHDTYRAFPRTI